MRKGGESGVPCINGEPLRREQKTAVDEYHPASVWDFRGFLRFAGLSGLSQS